MFRYHENNNFYINEIVVSIKSVELLVKYQLDFLLL